MTTLEMFERIKNVIPISQPLFFNYLNDTQMELQMMVSIDLLSVYGKQMDIHDNAEIDEGLPDSSVDTTKIYFDSETETYYSYIANVWTVLSTIECPDISSLSVEVKIAPLYHLAIVDNILYKATGAEQYKVNFMNYAKQAYATYWKAHNKKTSRTRREW